MIKNFLHQCLVTTLFLFLGTAMFAQTTITGTISDSNGETLIGASVIIKGTVTGTVTDYDGTYSLTTNQTPPFTIVASYTGFGEQEREMNGSEGGVDFTLEEISIMGSEVVVSASRKPEKIIESPVSIERMDAAAIKNTASANFYDAIENLKGVSLGTNSLTFKSVNTRGFASFANTRFVQMIDGVDNAAPGLNFPAGNLVGISELDVNSVELVPGAASALYGPNAFNGILLMTSKDPFLQPGLSVQIKGGVTQQDSGAGTNPYGEFGFRYAKAVTDKFAFKFNFSALQGTDWWAQDDSPVDAAYGKGSTGYDGLNLYGDEVATTLTLADITSPTFTNSFLVARTGYKEIDLVDDDMDATSYKFDASLHYKVAKNAELSYGYRYGAGQSIYQGANRYRLKGISLQNHRLELKGSNYFVRAYTTIENAGDSYDTKFQAWNVNRAWKADQDWFLDYVVAYNGITNFVNAINPAFVPLIPQSLLDMLPGTFASANPDEGARDFADGNFLNNDQLDAGAIAFLNAAAGVLDPTSSGWNRNDTVRQLPGSDLFETTKDRISLLADLATGSKFIDETKMYHAETMYNIAPHINDFMDVQLGGSFRHYRLSSSGTIFNDGPNGFNGVIPITEYGAYVQASKAFLEDDRLKASVSLRYDKSGNFDGEFSPRASVVYSLGEFKQHNIRASWQTGHRNPDTQPQYIALDLGPITLLGTTEDNMNNYSVERFYGIGESAMVTGAMVRDNSYTASSVGAFAAAAGMGNVDPSLLQKADIQYIKPEKVTVIELGYKGLPLASKKLFIDLNGYFNKYEDFISQYQVVTPFNGSVIDGSAAADIGAGSYSAYQLYGNTSTDVSSYGIGLNAEYSLPMKFKVGANYSYSKLIFDQEANPDFEPSFNTPEHRIKVMFGNSDVWKGIGFNLSYRWTDSYDWESSFGDGVVASNSVIDMQISAKIPAIKSIIKLGAANLLNQEYQTANGASFVGRQMYISITYDDLFRK